VHLAVLVGRDVPMSDSIGHDGPDLTPDPVRLEFQPAELTSAAIPADHDLLARARELAPMSRRKLARTLDITEHQARNLLDQLAEDSELTNGAVLR